MKDENEFYITLANGTTMKFRSVLSRSNFAEDNPKLFDYPARCWHIDKKENKAIDDYYYFPQEDNRKA